MCFSPQRRAIFRHQNVKKWSKHAVFCTFWLPNVLFATAARNFSTSELLKVLPDCQFFNILTSKCAFRHSGVQFFDIRTSKSKTPHVWTTFWRSDVEKLHAAVFKMCFSPQRRAIFRHQNFKKCSRTVSFLTFWLPNVLFATAACNFSTSERQKVKHRMFGPLFEVLMSKNCTPLSSKCAFRHSGAQFFDIRTSKSAPGLSVF